MLILYRSSLGTGDDIKGERFRHCCRDEAQDMHAAHGKRG
jgi:hypothetical protein